MRLLKCRLATLVVIVSPAIAHGGVKAVHRADLADAIDAHVERELDGLLDFYKDLHANPELSLHEQRSAAKVAAKLEGFGYSVTTGVGGHGLVGVLVNGPGPTVLIRGDMDALPITEQTDAPYKSTVQVTGTAGQPVGVMHACGHDVHQTCLVGTAGLLASLREQWSGTVMLIAQPAEEIGTGARTMIEDGLFERFAKPNYCLALHVAGDAPAGHVGYTSGWALANVDSVDITIHGKGGHGSRPNQTIDPVVTAAHVIVALQTVVSRRLDPIEPGVITVGSVHAGSKHNIISNQAVLQLTVRSYTDETRKILLDGIRDVTVNTCRAMGCKKDPDVVLRDDEFTPATYNDPQLVAAAVEVFSQVLGSDKVIAKKARMGGEDFGRYPKHLGVPGFIYWLGSVKGEVFEASQAPGGPPLPPLHSSKYLPDAPPTIATGVRCMTSLAVALLDPPQ